MPFDPTVTLNVHSFYSDHFLESLFERDESVRSVYDRWEEAANPPPKRLSALSREYFKAKADAVRTDRPEDRLSSTRGINRALADALGYDLIPKLGEIVQTSTGPASVPALTRVERDGSLYLVVLESGFGDENDTDVLGRAIPREATLLTEAADANTFRGTYEDALVALFRRDDPPRWVLILAGDQAILAERHKWGQGKWLRFNLDRMFGIQRDTYRQVAVMLARETLCPDGDTPLHDGLDDRSHRHAFGVSEDLKDGLREAVEVLANEYIYDLRFRRKLNVFSNEETKLASDLKEECLRYLYRLLFLFYAEARGGELGIIPINSDAYYEGYSLEHLRDLEQVPLDTPEAQNGYFLDVSLRQLFRLVNEGFGPEGLLADQTFDRAAFRIRGLHAPLFDEQSSTPTLAKGKFRNSALQKVLQLLSLSRPAGRRERGRISYAQLGINQLGAVYEGILSYSGFFAKEDLYVVREAGKPDAPIFFVPESETANYRADEFVTDPDPDRQGHTKRRIHEKGSFVFHLAGRDRESSASYYTPEVLTKCVVERALKERLNPLAMPQNTLSPCDEDVRASAEGEGAGGEGESDRTRIPLAADEILDLSILEPAVGSGAFLNEAVSQLADAYLERKQAELGELIPPAQMNLERQKVKAYLAANNVYGVDLNPIAAELAKVGLWLNTLYKDSETPWYGLRIAVGNSLVGCRRAVYSAIQVAKGEYRDCAPTPLPMGPEWTPVPKGAIYHFLLPDAGMVEVTDKVVKGLAPEATAKIKEWRKEFISSKWERGELERLAHLSQEIDKLWLGVVKERREAAEKCRYPKDIWGQPPVGETAKKPAEQEAIAAELEENFHAGPRLKLLMDYWCALWFWPLERADDLPTQHVWLSHIETLLKGTDRGITKSQLPGFEAMGVDTEAEQRFITEHGYVNTDEMIKKLVGLNVAFACGERHRFHHWELRFADLFADRGGFDLILGNPPWVKLEWNESGLLSEAEPQFALRKMNASDVGRARQTALAKPGIREAYVREAMALLGSTSFYNAEENYPLLKGVQTNLFRLFIERAWSNLSRAGVTGYLHPEGIYDDPRGGKFRSVLYSRLRLHAQFLNELKLFSEVHHLVSYSVNIYGPIGAIAFDHVSNLYHPRTLVESEGHDGHGLVPGIKNADNQWETRPHSSRIVRITERELSAFAQIFDEPGTPAARARLPMVHSKEILTVLYKLSLQPRRLNDSREKYLSSECWHETVAQDEGTIRRETRFPVDSLEWIVSGPHFHVATPLNKTPNERCQNNLDYSAIDVASVADDYMPRTNYVPNVSRDTYLLRQPTWKGQSYTDFYRLGFRKMLSITGSRTLIGAIQPPEVAHIHGVIGIAMTDHELLVDFAGLTSSLVFDFLVRTTGKANLDVGVLPAPKLTSNQSSEIRNRALRLMCTTSHFASIYEELSDMAGLPFRWERNCVERTDSGRRQLLVELDALAAIALGLTEEELVTIYRVQFPVLQEYERTNRYDANGRLVPSAILNRARTLELNTKQPLDPRLADRPGEESLLFDLPPIVKPGRKGTRANNAEDPRLVAIDHPKLGQVAAFAWTDPKMEPRMERHYVPPFIGFDREEDMLAAYRRFAHLANEPIEETIP